MAQNNYIVPDHVPVPDIEDVELEAPTREVGVQCNLGGADRYYLVLNIEDVLWRVEEVRPLEEDEMGVEIVEEVIRNPSPPPPLPPVNVAEFFNGNLPLAPLPPANAAANPPPPPPPPPPVHMARYLWADPMLAPPLAPADAAEMLRRTPSPLRNEDSDVEIMSEFIWDPLPDIPSPETKPR